MTGAPRTTLRAIVVDDELLAREGLRDELLRLDVDVVALCADGYEARESISSLRPDLLFLDIQMPEVDGFAVLEGLEPEELPPAIIFVTAYDQHAVRAFESRALDYLLKPVQPARLHAAVARATQRVLEARALRDATPPESGNSGKDAYLSQLIVRERDQATIIPVSDLEWVEAETYYVRLHATGVRPRLLRERMSVLESRLNPEQFFRAHRSAIVRLDLVRTINTLSRYEHNITLATGAHVPLARDRRARLESRLADARRG